MKKYRLTWIVGYDADVNGKSFKKYFEASSDEDAEKIAHDMIPDINSEYKNPWAFVLLREISAW